MIPTFGMVILPQNPSTENGQDPGWGCILSVASTNSKLQKINDATATGMKNAIAGVAFLARGGRVVRASMRGRGLSGSSEQCQTIVDEMRAFLFSRS